MQFIPTKIPEVIMIEPTVFNDERGYFFESYNKKLFAEGSITNDFVQDNQSLSTYGTVRGLHFQTGNSAQAKLVRVLEGRVLDVAVDLRQHSKTYGHHVAVELSDSNKRQLFVPRGFAHGFSVLSDTAVFAYKCDNFYDPKSEGGIIHNDLDLGIDWLIPDSDIVISNKDKNLLSYTNYKANPCF